jgi:hypothetical protein
MTPVSILPGIEYLYVIPVILASLVAMVLLGIWWSRDEDD